jgi:hypothetical protein
VLTKIACATAFEAKIPWFDRVVLVAKYWGIIIRETTILAVDEDELLSALRSQCKI